MSRKSFEIENSLNIRPKATADLDANSQGDIDVDSTINRPVYNDGSSNLAVLLAGDAPPLDNYITSLTGDVTAAGPGAAAATIANDAVSNAKLANMAASTIKGNATGGSADPADLTVSQAQSLLEIPTTSSPLALNKGGTGTSAASANAAFNALSPMTTAGDLIKGGVSGAATRVPIGVNGEVLGVVAGDIAWTTPAGLTAVAIGASPNANGLTISGSNINLQPADGSFGGVVTTGTQTFAGDKTFSSAITPSGGIVGSNGTSDATAGNFGEYVENFQSSVTNFGTSGQWFDGASILLTPGDWDLTGIVDAYRNGTTTMTSSAAGIGTSSGNSTAGASRGESLFSFISPTSADGSQGMVPGVRRKVTTNTTFYLKIAATYSGGTPQYRCRLSARRVR